MNNAVQIGFNRDTLDIQRDHDLWSMNNFHKALPDFVDPAGWFQIHKREDWGMQTPDHIEWLHQKHPFPIWMHGNYDDVPSGVRLPVADLIRLWPYSSVASFASSFSWMIAMAIHLEYESIYLTDITMSTPREAFMEVPNLMLWAGIAGGRGIDFVTDSPLFETYLYGFEDRTVPEWVPREVATDLLVDFHDEVRWEFMDWSKRHDAWLDR